MISAKKWNDLVARVWRNQIIGVRVDETTAFRHPWNIRARWVGKQVAIQIHAGMVNGIEAGVKVTDREGKISTVALGEKPELMLPAGIFGMAESVPIYFSKWTISTAGSEADKKARVLRSADVVLVIPRPSATVTIEADERGIPRMVTAIRRPGPEDGPMISFRRKWESDPEPSPVDFALNGLTADTGAHTELLATVFLLSPEGADRELPPDSTWAIHVWHELFWNLNHAVRLPLPALHDNPISAEAFASLAGGAGSLIIGGIVDEINRNNALAEIMLARTRVKSWVWSV